MIRFIPLKQLKTAELIADLSLSKSLLNDKNFFSGPASLFLKRSLPSVTVVLVEEVFLGFFFMFWSVCWMSRRF